LVVVDCDMFGDISSMPSSVVLNSTDVLLNPRVALQDGFKVVWAIDIDSEDFYRMPMSREYIKDNIKAFKLVAKEKMGSLILISDDYYGDNKDYKAFLDEKMEICEAHSCKLVKVPQLFGPSARMRYDTILNEMFMAAFVGGIIHVEDWLRRYPVCSVAIAGEYIVDNVILKDGKEYKRYLRNCMLSLCDYAGIMMKVFDGKAQLSLSGDKLAIYDYNEESVEALPFERYTIHKSFEYMINSLEKDGIKDMVRDCHNNSKMLSNVHSYGNLIKAIGKYGE